MTTWREFFNGLRAWRPSRQARLIAVGCVAALVLAIGGSMLYQRLTTMKVTGYFASTSGLYVGDDVRVLGVPVGRIDAIEPGREYAKVSMTVDRSVDIPADAKAVIVAPNLVSARFIQLAPVYRGGPTMRDGAEIAIRDTAVPVEWDDIKNELDKLSTALGPHGGEQGSLGRALDTAAKNLDGNGKTMRATLQEVSQTMSVLSDGRTDLFATVRNLQAFVSALANSNTQIVQFGGRLASVSQVLAASSGELGGALTELDTALGEVRSFVANNRQTLTESLTKLTDATQILVDKRPEVEKVLHLAPNSLVNFYQLYKPAQGSLTGVLGLNNVTNPVQFLCGAVEAMSDNDSQRSADLCKQYLGPVLNTLAVNYLPMMTSPMVGLQAYPDQLEYSTPELAQVTVPRNISGLMLPGGGKK